MPVLSTAEELLDAKSRAIESRPIFDSYERGKLSLFDAVERDDVEVVRRLLRSDKECIHIRNGHGWTPLHVASAHGRVSMVKTLLQANADVNAVDEFGQTPLLVAKRSGQADIVTILVQAGADVNVADELGWTLLHEASVEGNVNVLTLLVNANAKLLARDEKGGLPLHYAAQFYRFEAVHWFLTRGIEVHSEDNHGLQPMHLCIQKNPFLWDITDELLKTLQVLISFGAVWDDKCDELSTTVNARKEAPALRICILTWAQELKDERSLTNVPTETIKRGAEATQLYIDELKKSKAVIHRIKICVVGPSKAGKTSLVTSLTTQNPSLEHPEDRTIGVNHVILRFEIQKDGKWIIYEVTFWDFAGQNEYHVAHSLFYSKRTLYLVCVDMEVFLMAFMQAEVMGHTKTQWERLMNEIIERDVLRWVRNIFTRQPDAEFVFIATKDDLLTEFPQFTNEVKSFLSTKLSQVEGIVNEMKRELKQPVLNEQRSAEMLTVYAYQQRMEKNETGDDEWFALTQDTDLDQEVEMESDVEPMEEDGEIRDLIDLFAKLEVQPLSTIKDDEEYPQTMMQHVDPRLEVENVAPKKISSLLFASCVDLNVVKKALETITSLIVTSERSFAMPESYTNVLNAIKDIRKDPEHRSGDAKVTHTFVRLDAFLNTLMTKVPNMNKTTCRLILQTLHDLGDILWYEDLAVIEFRKTVILDPLFLINFVRQVITHQNKQEVLAHGVLKTLPFWMNLHTNEIICAMKQLLQTFQLVYPTDGEMQWDSDLIVPAFWNSKLPACWVFGYEDLRLEERVPNRVADKSKEKVRVHWEYHFIFEFPDTFFDHLVVATYSPFMTRRLGSDWIMYAQDGVYACRAMVSRAPITLERVLQLEAVLGVSATEDDGAELWDAFECLSQGIVKVLRRYPGLEVACIALDREFSMKKLESLFSWPLRQQSRKWMPPERIWESYKNAVQGKLLDDDTSTYSKRPRQDEDTRSVGKRGRAA